MKKHKIIYLLIIIILISITYVITKYSPFSFNYEKLEKLINNNKDKSFFIIFFFQILQVVIPFIPSDAINVLAGLTLGPLVGSIVSISGLLQGSLIAFYLARIFKRKLIEKLVNKEKLEKVEAKINSSSSLITLYLFSFIPFMPRDILVYAFGLTNINAFKFFFIYILARAPLIILMNYLGDNVLKGNKTFYLILFIILILLIIFNIVKKKTPKCLNK